GAVVAVVGLAVGAEHLVEVPAGRKVERQFRARQPGALRAGWCRIDGHQACQAADEMMLKRKPQDALIGLLGGGLAQPKRHLGIRDLTAGPHPPYARPPPPPRRRRRVDPWPVTAA